MIEWVHAIVSAKPVGVSVWIQPFPNCRGTLFHWVEPGRILLVKQKFISDVTPSTVRQGFANPCSADESCQQSVWSAYWTIIHDALPFDSFCQVRDTIVVSFSIQHTKGDRQHIRCLCIDKLSFSPSSKSRRYCFSCCLFKVCVVKERYFFLSLVRKVFLVVCFPKESRGFSHDVQVIYQVCFPKQRLVVFLVFKP